MTEFATHGFLSDEIREFEAEILANFKNRFDLADEANKAAHEIIYSVNIHKNLTELLLATLLTRQAASFQSFLILIQKGLMTQAEIILRNISETMFIVGAVGKDEAFAEKFVLSEEVSRKKALVRLRENHKKYKKEIDQETIDLIDELERKIREQRIETFTTERIAQIAELSDYYDTLYPLTSLAVHTSARGLDKALDVDGEGEVLAIDYGPIRQDFEMQLDAAISMTLYTFHEVASHFGVEVEKIEQLQRKNQELSGAA